MKNTVIFHSGDMDGVFCREIAKKFLPKDTEFIGWNFGDETIKVASVNGSKIYVMDLSPDCIDPVCLGAKELENLIWIDHHKTAIDKWPTHLHGYRIDGVAACRLAWQYFAAEEIANRTGEAPRYPEKRHFVDRIVQEPWAVRLAGEYDIWDKRDPDAETFQYGLRVQDWKGKPEDLQTILNEQSSAAEYIVAQILRDGQIAQRYAQNVDASTCKRAFLLEWEGLKFLCINSAKFNSLLFASRDVPETGHDALMGFCYDGKNWVVSLYHAKHRTDLDLSAIAKKYGGGGHKGACGFSTKLVLPFQSELIKQVK